MTLPPQGLVLNIYKPAGMTSFDVVRTIRYYLKVRKVGHCGTLDPIAEGVLIVLVGKATKRADEFSGLDKSYRAGILLGRTTDTYDITGETISESNTLNVKLEDIEEQLKRFTGEIEQIPPMYSALKVGGKRLYRMARRGVKVEIEPRKVKIYHSDILSWDNPHLKIIVHCSKGTYIRSLANDLGKVLGCGGCLESLVRTAVGDYRMEDAIHLKDIEQERIKVLL